MKNAFSTSVRWVEPLGQLIVLVALGLQFFFVDPSTDEANRALNDSTQTILQQMVIDKDQNGISLDKKVIQLRDNQLSDYDRARTANQQKEKYSIVYISIFVLGTLLVIIGKFADVMYET